MPPRRNSTPPPQVMTWGKASFVLVIALILDAARLMFEMFWFFGPALAALYCANSVSDTVGTTVTKVAGGAITAGCTALAGVAGFFGSPAIAAFGVVMAIAIGLFGWLVIGLILMWTNARIFKENALWFVSSLAISEIPLVGSIPALTLILGRMYHHQIKTEQAAFKAYEKEQAAAQLAVQQQQTRQLMQAQQQVQVAQQVAANDAAYAQAANEQEIAERERTRAEAANDENFNEIPEEVRKAA